MTPEETLEHLKKDATARTCRTLDAIYKVCTEQVARGLHDFAYPTIAKLGKGTGVPQAQTIRNATGEPYRILLQAFVNAAPRKQVIKANKGENAWIEEIEDATQRYLTRVMLSKLNEAQRTLKEFVAVPREIIVDDRASVSNGAEAVKLTKSESRAITYLLSDDFLHQWNFKRGDNGDVLDENGLKVFKPGTIDALEKVLRHL